MKENPVALRAAVFSLSSISLKGRKAFKRPKQGAGPRPAGPSTAPTLCWGGGGVAPPSISETNRRGGKIQTAVERPGWSLSDNV